MSVQHVGVDGGNPTSKLARQEKQDEKLEHTSRQRHQSTPISRYIDKIFISDRYFFPDVNSASSVLVIKMWGWMMMAMKGGREGGREGGDG